MFTCDGAHDHQDVDSFPTRRSSDLWYSAANAPARAASPTPMNPTPMNFGARCRMIASPVVDCVSLARERSRLHLDAARADELGPPARVFLEEPGEFCGSEARRLGSLRGELFPDVGSRERPDDVLAQGVDGFLRRPLGEREPEPVGDEVIDALLERG